MPITAQEAQALLTQEQRKLNQGRVLPPVLDRIRVLMRDETFPICNVGPWEYRAERGCLSVFIPAYDPAKDPAKLGYARSEPLAVIRREAKIINEDEFGFIEDDGHMVAQDLIGIGWGMHPQNSLVPFGVFVPAGKEPTPAEIAAAKDQLSLYYDRLIEEARDAYDKGPEARKNTITDRHLTAARIKGIDEAWTRHQHTEASVRCQMCGKFNPAGIAKCACGQILDFELFQKLQKQQEDMLERATKPAPVQPPVKR
jgi:hypothetical protein